VTGRWMMFSLACPTGRWHLGERVYTKGSFVPACLSLSVPDTNTHTLYLSLTHSQEQQSVLMRESQSLSFCRVSREAHVSKLARSSFIHFNGRQIMCLRLFTTHTHTNSHTRTGGRGAVASNQPTCMLGIRSVVCGILSIERFDFFVGWV
jgi:hypothetical protein